MDSDDEMIFKSQQIDSSDDEGDAIFTVKRSKVLTIDSDNESTNSDTVDDVNNKTNNLDDDCNSNINGNNKIMNCDSESDNNSNYNKDYPRDIADANEKTAGSEHMNNSDSDDDLIESPSKSKRRLIDTDSSSDDEQLFSTKAKDKLTNSDEEDLTECQAMKQKPITYDSDIYDQELSEDEATVPISNEQNEEEGPTLSAKPRTKKNRAASEKARVAMVQEIYSEKQRMIRNSEISLPYHRPKPRTLKEFLERKKYTPTTKMSLKMSMKDMRLLKDIENRRKEVDTFYKSESDDEKDGDMDESCSTPIPEESTPQVCSLVSPAKEPQCDSGVLLSSLQSSDGIASKNLPSPNSYDNQLRDESIDLSEKVATVDESDNIECDKGSSETGSPQEEITSDGLKLNISHSSDEAVKDDKPKDNHFEYMNTEDFDLHLDSEEITELVRGNSIQDQPVAPPPATNTPKLSLLASKFPDMDLNKIAKLTPKISALPDGFIEFGDSPKKIDPAANPDVDDILERLMRSTATKKLDKKTEVMLDIVQKETDANGDERLVSSSINVKLESPVEKSRDVTPGAQLVQLKSRLKAKFLRNREEARQRRVKEKQFLDCEEVITDYQDGLPDEEQELTDQSDTDVETESEPEENDIIMEDTARPKNPFIEDEADEDSDDADDDIGGSDDNGDSDDNEAEVDAGTINIESNSKKQDDFDSDSDRDEIFSKSKEKKGRFVILSDDESSHDKVASDDESSKNKVASDTEELHLFYDESMDIDAMVTKEANSTKTKAELSSKEQYRKRSPNDLEESFSSMDSSLELIGSIVPPNQPYGGQRKKKKSNENSAVSPPENKMSFFTQLVDADPMEKPERNSYEYSLSQFGDSEMSNKSSYDSRENTNVAKKTINTDDLDILGLCSGLFSGTQKPEEESRGYENSGFDDVLGLCSGVFATQPPETQMEKDVGSSLDLTSTGLRSPQSKLMPELSGGVKCSTEADNFLEDANSTKSEVPLIQCDEVVSSGIVEDDAGSQDKTLACSPQTAAAPLAVELSSDEEGILSRQSGPRKSFKRKRRVYTLSDDENSENQSDEESRPKKKSTGFKDRIKGGIRAEFLEAEAELSGSDFDSADEYEPDEDDDIMEQEQGDLDKFDEEDLRDEVGKAHMKSMIDKDKRELRILQELYFEDGDLHGQGRQRKFRWKNMAATDESTVHQSDSEEGEEDDTQEAERRKERFEREKFIQDSKQAESDIEMSINNSSVKVVTNTRKMESVKKSNNDNENSPFNLFGFQANRGSFLSRNKSTLKKLAVLTKENQKLGGAKQGGNFVFQQFSAEEAEMMKEKAASKPVTKIVSGKVSRADRSFFSLDEETRSSSIFKHL